MKKIFLVACATFIALGAAAQADLVKAAKQNAGRLNGYESYKQMVEQLSPAFTHPETATQAETYYVPGKAGFKLYDLYFTQQSLGGPVNPEEMGKILMDGYNFFMKAFPLDSVPDAKGKIKPKHSKDMVNEIVGHHTDFDRMAVAFWQAGDFELAYDAWDAVVDIPSNPRYKSTDIKPYPDSVVSQIRYNQGLAAYQAHNFPKALRALDESFAKGDQPVLGYEIAYQAARMASDSTAMLKYAMAGWDKFGSQEPVFLQWAVNSFLDRHDYAGARQLLSDAMSKSPSEPAIYVSYGILSESENDLDSAEQNYLKAKELCPTAADPYYYLGRVYSTKYENLYQDAGMMPQSEYNKYAAETLIPLLKQAAENYEKAYQINPELTAVLNPLKSIYYQLNDADNMNRIEQILNNL